MTTTHPQNPFSQSISALSHECSDIYSTLRTHKRYTLRLIALISITIGSVLNFVSFFIAFIAFHGDDAPRYLVPWASVCLGISFLWNSIDLASHSDRIFPHKQFLTVHALLFMDGLGFLCYLTLLIANGIIISSYHRDSPASFAIIFAYNSVPWMICCATHALIALQSLYGILIDIGYGSTCCPDCGRKAKSFRRKTDNSVKQSLLGATDERDGYQDLEVGVGDGADEE